jgi:hypothetical protein
VGGTGSGKGIVATVFSIVAAVECQVDYEFFQKKKNSSSPSPTVTVAQAIPLGFSKKYLPHHLYIGGEKAVTVSGYWQKPLTVTALAVIKFH